MILESLNRARQRADRGTQAEMVRVILTDLYPNIPTWKRVRPPLLFFFQESFRLARVPIHFLSFPPHSLLLGHLSNRILNPTPTPTATSV